MTTITVTLPPKATRNAPLAYTRPARRAVEVAPDKSALRVVHISAEYWPYASSGGLGQAVADLAGYQARSSLRPAVILPLHRVARDRAGTLKLACEPFQVHQDGAMTEVRCYEREQQEADRPQVFFIEHTVFDRAGMYGEGGKDYPDNSTRFGLFAVAVLELLRRVNFGAVVLHVHDWHGALVPVYMHTGCTGHEAFPRLPTVLSVHNGGYQGVFEQEKLRPLGLPDYMWSEYYMEWYGRLNFLKGALRFADMVTTVSPTHANEIRSEVGGFGLHGVFQWLGPRLVGIRNGIDSDRWNPRIDPEIAAHYHAGDLRGKAECKAVLQARFGLDVNPDAPLFAMSCRLAKQKGVDLVLGSDAIRQSHAQFVLMGDGDPGYAAALRDLAKTNPKRIATSNFTDHLEHVVIAGADFLLMPSLYEPCGLTQMRAQRYGTLPIVRRVGGLADTVDDTVGFVFDAFDPPAFDEAIQRALAVYQDRGEHARRIAAAMQRDFSWAGPLSAYLRTYNGALSAVT